MSTYFFGNHVVSRRACCLPQCSLRVCCALLFLGVYLVGGVLRLGGSLQPLTGRPFWG